MDKSKDEGTSNQQHKGSGQEQNKKRKRKEVAIFGNYRNYYGYRVGQDLEEDPRLKVFKQEWFENRDCLDIGCNSGSITIAIAKKFGCGSILGIDIDGDRVQDACWTLRKTARTANPKISGMTSKLEVMEKMNGVQCTATGLSKEETTDNTSANLSPKGQNIFEIVKFQKGNFIQNWKSPDDKCYHTILCLSVSKWIHLNWGDDGLITLFSRVWKLLHPGGIFILEPQPWESYYKNRLVSEVTQSNYLDIKIYPDSFQEILLDKIGFRKVENITSSLSGTKAGFGRPILAFWK